MSKESTLSDGEVLRQREQFFSFVGEDALSPEMLLSLQESERGNLKRKGKPVDFYVSPGPDQYEPPASFRDRKELNELLRFAARNNANDLHIGDYSPMKMRVSGTLFTLTERSLTTDEVRSLMTSLYNDSASAVTTVLGGVTLNTAYECPASDSQDRSRWRVIMNLRYASGGLGLRLVLRRIDSDPPPLSKIYMPSDIIESVEGLQRGMFLMTGPTGSGKSTSLAGLAAHRLAMPDHSDHLLTIESPIEFVYDRCPKPFSEVTQWEVPRMKASFNAGIVDALRSDPDLIIVGEMRDKITMHSGIEGALTGHGMLSTMHTNSVVSTVDRILKTFDFGEREAIKLDLIDNLHMIVSQLLARTVDGGRMAFRERLAIDGSIKERLRKAPNLSIALRQEMKSSGRLMIDEARDAYKDGRISDDVLRWYENMDRMEREAYA